nr:poly-gamma-glutamate system protein [uncultured Dethiosulfovibrio sp.]
MWLVVLLPLCVFCASSAYCGERPSASSIMESYIDFLSQDIGFDLVGEEFTSITTTLGHLEDKERSLDPRFAKVLSGFFNDLGLTEGDAVAVGASGSFPGLLLAVLAACESMELRPLLICSLGSSMYGANRPGATIVDMVRSLYSPSKVDSVLLGFSLGGGGDRGEGALFPEWEGALMNEAIRLGGDLILEPNLSSSVSCRMELYLKSAGERGIGCFVGVGGAAVTFGVGEAAAAFPNGVTMEPFDGMPEEGLLSGFLRRGVPVIHLLCVRSLLGGA